MRTSKTQIVYAPATVPPKPIEKKIKIVHGTPKMVDVKQTNPSNTNNEEEQIEKVKYVPQNISRRIIDARTKLGLTQVQFAQQAGINVNVLKAYENGSTVPNQQELQRIGKVAKENFNKI